MSEQRRIREVDTRRNQFRCHNRGRQSKNKYQMIKTTGFNQDNPTTDCTKQSTQFRNLRSKGIQESLKDLQRQNESLKQQIISLKTEQFLKINQQKLKELILENQYLKKQIVDQGFKIDQFQMQKQLLKRSNLKFRVQCDNLKKQVKHLKNKINKEFDQRSQKSQASNSDIDQICRSIYKSASSKILLNRKKRKQVKENKKSQEQSIWNNDYYGKKRRKQRQRQQKYQ